MSKVQKNRLNYLLVLIFYPLIHSGQVELKIEPSKYSHLDSAVVFYCQDDSLVKQVFRFDFDSFLFDEVSWYYDSNKLLFYYATKTLLSTCSSSGNNEVKITFGYYLIKCFPDIQELKKVEIISNRKYPNFKDILIDGDELIFLLNKHEVERVMLGDNLVSKITEFFK